MIFKDYLPFDNLTMLNLDEFGDKIELNEVEIQAVIEKTTKPKSGNRQLNYPGLHGDFVEMFFRIEDYYNQKGKMIKQGDICYLNGKRYTVEEVTDEQGMAHVILSEYRQNHVAINPASISRAKLE